MRKIKIRIILLSIPFTAFLILSAPAFAQETPKPDATAVKNPSDAKALTAPESADAKDSQATKEEQSSYVYDLKKLIEKSKDNIKRVNEKIQEQAIYKRNLLREEKAREYYERALQLFEEGKPQEAREYWEKSIKITEHPEMKDYIKGSEKRFKLQAEALKKEERDRMIRSEEDQKVRDQQVQEAYNTAVTLYKQRKYKPAREEFMLVEQLVPEYKATRSYLKLLEQNIAVQDKEDLKSQQKEIARQQQEAEDARIREKELWRKEIDFKEQERRTKLSKQAQEVYQKALALYKKKDFIGAKEKFQEVEWVIPDYKATRQYLDKLDAEIKKHEAAFAEQKEKERQKKAWDEELARRKQDSAQKKEIEQKDEEQKRRELQEAEVKYQSGIRLLTEKKYQESRDTFVEVQKIYPNYKATEAYIERLNGKLGIIETAPEKVSDDVKIIYADAVRAYKDRDYAVAKQKFERVEFMYPNYEATRRYLGKLDKNYDFKKTVLKDDALIKEEPKDKDKKPSAAPAVAPASSKEYEALVAKVEPLYTQARTLYEEKKLQDALKQFEAVDAVLPDYKSTRPYMKRIGQQIKKIEQQRYKEEQFKQAEIINTLAKQANSLFLKIQQLADDSLTASAKRKFAMVDKLFANMSKEQAKLLAEILEEEKKLKLEEIAYEQEVQKSEFASLIDPIYDEAVKLYDAKRYDEAKAKFLEAQSKIADYRSSSRYLALIEKQNRLMAQLMADRENQIKEFQVKADQSAKQQAKRELEAKEQGMIRDLVAQASTINDEIVALSKDRNFEVIKAKFAELEKIVDNLLTIKNSAAEREMAEHPKVQKKTEQSPTALKNDFNPPARKSKRNKYDKVPLRHQETESQALQAPVSAPAAEVQPPVAPPVAPQVAPAPVVEAPKPVSPPVSADPETAAIAHITAVQTEQMLTAGKSKAEQEQQLRIRDKENRELYLSAIKDFDNRRFGEAKAKFVTLEGQEKYNKSARQFIEKIDYILVSEQNKMSAAENKKKEEEFKAKQEQEHTAAQAVQAQSQKVVETRVRQEKAARVPVRILARPAVHRDYLASLDLRVRRPVEPQVVNESQVSGMKPIAPAENTPPPAPFKNEPPKKMKAAKKVKIKPEANPQPQSQPQPVAPTAAATPSSMTTPVQPSAATAPNATQAAAGVSPNEDASWLKRRKQKALSAKRKKYLDEQYKAAQKQKEEQAREEKENQVKLLAMAKREKEPVPGENAVADDPVLRRQKELERKNRALYERELRRKPVESSGLAQAVEAANREDKRQAQAAIKRQQEVLRMQREEDEANRRDKERQIATRIGQGQDVEGAPKTDLSELRAARLKKDMQAKPNGNPELEPKPVVTPKRVKKSRPQPQAQPSPTPPPSRAEIELPPINVVPDSSSPQDDRRLDLKSSLRDQRNQQDAVKSDMPVVKITKGPKDKRAEKPASVEKPKPTPKPKPAPKPKPEKDPKLIEQERARKEFESGLDNMYREALSFYKGGMYEDARQKFAAIENLSPNYKRTRNYMHRTDEEILKDQKRRSSIKEAKLTQPVQTLAKPARNAPVEPAPSKDEAIANALDLFDTQK